MRVSRRTRESMVRVWCGGDASGVGAGTVPRRTRRGSRAETARTQSAMPKRIRILIPCVVRPEPEPPLRRGQEERPEARGDDRPDRDREERRALAGSCEEHPVHVRRDCETERSQGDPGGPMHRRPTRRTATSMLMNNMCRAHDRARDPRGEPPETRVGRVDLVGESCESDADHRIRRAGENHRTDPQRAAN